MHSFSALPFYFCLLPEYQKDDLLTRPTISPFDFFRFSPYNIKNACGTLRFPLVMVGPVTEIRKATNATRPYDFSCHLLNTSVSLRSCGSRMGRSFVSRRNDGRKTRLGNLSIGWPNSSHGVSVSQYHRLSRHCVQRNQGVGLYRIFERTKHPRLRYA